MPNYMLALATDGGNVYDLEVRTGSQHHSIINVILVLLDLLDPVLRQSFLRYLRVEGTIVSRNGS